MPSISQKKDCDKHQWMSFAIDGSCIKCVDCGEIRMLSTNSNEIIKINENK
jgi:hypothetical protein